MCGVAEAALGVGLVSTMMNAGGQIIQMRQQESAAKSAAAYNAQVAANEEAVQQQLARNEIAKGIADLDRQQRKAAQAMGQMRANMGASGFEMDSGSNLSLLAQSATEHQYDSNIISNNAAMSAWQHEVGATSAANQGAFARWQGSTADSGRFGSMLGIGGTVLGGIGQGMGMYNQFSSLSGSTGTGNPVQSQSPGWTYDNDDIWGFSDSWNYRG